MYVCAHDDALSIYGELYLAVVRACVRLCQKENNPAPNASANAL